MSISKIVLGVAMMLLLSACGATIYVNGGGRPVPRQANPELPEETELIYTEWVKMSRSEKYPMGRGQVVCRWQKSYTDNVVKFCHDPHERRSFNLRQGRPDSLIVLKCRLSKLRTKYRFETVYGCTAFPADRPDRWHQRGSRHF